MTGAKRKEIYIW